ncbi:MAG: hypothetical protein HYX74_09275 [Acidobacteria bacterium]|nr:hypothetical protein [Acidobacteriota bacterium]
MRYRYYNYFTEIEEYFVRQRGKHMLVSPLDWSLLESWKQVGIPLHVVFRGIERALHKHQARGTLNRVNSIFYCQPSVMECFEEYQQSTVGQADPTDAAPGEDAGNVARALRQLRQHLDRVGSSLPEREVADRVGRMMDGLLAEVGGAKPPAMAAVEETLQVCDSILLESARRHLEPVKLDSFQQEARQGLKVYKKKVAPEMYRRIEENFINRKIRQEYDLPEFSLFFLG